MKAPEALQEALRNPDFLAVSGSKLYGTNRPTSDDDFRGFVFPPHEYILNTAVHESGYEDSFEERELPPDDHKVIDARRFLHLTMKGDPQLTELFYVPSSKIVTVTAFGLNILALRDMVVSNAIFKRVIGYGYSEWRKAMGVKLEVSELTKTEDDVINDIRNVFAPEKQDMDDIIDMLKSKKQRKLVDSKKNLGAKRKAEFDKFGFGVTSAAHAIRLAQEITELMLTKTITFPRPNAALLLDIRLGKYDVPQVTEMYNEAVAKADEARPKSVLRDKPDRAAVLGTYDLAARIHLRNNERFKS